MGHYSPDGREIEIRVPREPLNIQGTTIGVQVQMSLRDGLPWSSGPAGRLCLHAGL